jgi:hypothetical protein
MADPNDKEQSTDGDTARSQVAQSSERGLLHLTLEFSSRDVIAGGDFSIFVLVTNPYPVPVKISDVNVSLPSELKLSGQDTMREARARFRKEEVKHAKELRRNRDSLNKLLTDLRETLDALRRQLGDVEAAEVTNERLSNNLNKIESALREVEERSSGSQVLVDGGTIDTVNMSSYTSTVKVIRGVIDSLNIQEPWLAAEERSRTHEVKLQSSLPLDTALQPGNTVVYTTILRAKNPITMSPSKFRLQFSVNYTFPLAPQEEPPAIYTNTISQEVAIRAPVYYLMTGALVGALFGSLARVLAPTTTTTGTNISPVISILISVILGAAAVVFLARKSDAGFCLSRRHMGRRFDRVSGRLQRHVLF